MNINIKNSRLTIWLLTWSLLISLTLAPQTSLAEDGGQTIQEVEEIYELLKENHLSGVGGQELIHEAIRAMVASLGDPYTEYFSPKEWQHFLNQLDQEYVGVGLILNEQNGQFVISRVILDGPADLAGFEVGDVIIAVDGTSVKGKTIQQLSQSITGEEGTSVKIKINRGETTKEFEIKRAKIKIPVVVSKSFDNRVGYIQLTTFSSDADELFIKKKKELEDQGIESLIIDLRGNGGGLLDTASNIAAQFIEEGILIKTHNRNDVEQTVEIFNGSQVRYPVIVLVDQDSASASEVLAGALKDYQLATVIGTNTFGKGTVQQSVPLSSGGVLKITIEEYFSPKGHKVNKVGIAPDIEARGDLEGLVASLFRLTGKIDLTEKGTKTVVNGMEWNATLPYIKEGKEIWISSRLAAALLGLEVKWDPKLKIVSFNSPEGSGIKPPVLTTSMIKMSKGISYINADSLMKLDKKLAVALTKQGLSIQYSFK
jgi:carboxyl-terminal processing protease